MYVGNATKQFHDFVYWVPGAKSTRTQRVPIGGQVLLSGELDREAIDGIIQQHAPYGFAAASEVDHLTDLIGLCYAIDKPVPMTAIHKLMMHNAELLRERGKQIRREASIAGNEHLETSLQESGLNSNLRQMEASLVEENHDPRSPDPEMAEGFRVIRGGVQDAPKPARRRGRRRAA